MSRFLRLFPVQLDGLNAVAGTNVGPLLALAIIQNDYRNGEVIRMDGALGELVSYRFTRR